MENQTRGRLTLICILTTILLDMIGLGMITPVLPDLLEEMTGGSVAEAAVIGGYLVFVYALMQFIFSPVLGNLSDRFGRRPVLLASLVGLIFDNLMMALAPFVWYLFIGRFISGIAGAAVGTATAYMADITPPEKRTSRFGLIGAAFGLGFIIGPVIGGELGQFGPRVPFYAAAALAFANFLFGLFILPESLPKTKRRKFDLRRANPFGAIVHLSRYPAVMWLLMTLLLFSLAAQAYPSVFSYFTNEVFDFSSAQIGRALGAFGIGFAICQAILVGPLVKRLGEVPVVFVGFGAAAVAFFGTAYLADETLLYVYIGIGAMSGLGIPAVNGLLSRNVPDDQQGELQGAVNASNSLANIIGPLAATQIFGLFTTPGSSFGYFPGAPFMAAGIVVIASLVVFFFAAYQFDLVHRPSLARHPKVPEQALPGQLNHPEATPSDNDTENGDGEVKPEDRDPPVFRH